MSQFDWGTMDPYVVDGVQLADDLNQFRSALNSLHAGSTRPPYVVPGMLWINTAGGATAWVLSWYVSPTVGDVALFTLNTSTGAITISAAAGGTLASAILLAQAAANPQVQWNATGNAVDVKNWRMTVNGAGALVLSSYTDAGVVVASITFNRDGTIGTPGGWRQLGRVVPTAGQATVDFQNIPADINDLEFRFDVTPTLNAADFNVRFYNASNVLITAATHNTTATQANTGMGATGSAPAVYSYINGSAVNLNASTATRRVNNSSTLGGIRGFGKVANMRAVRIKSVQWMSEYLADDSGPWISATGAGSYNVAMAITGLQFFWGSGGSTFAAGGAITLRGSP